MRELFERERYLHNLTAYGVPESSYVSILEKISHDKLVIGNILVFLVYVVLSNL